jgi:hypothetical protein
MPTIVCEDSVQVRYLLSDFANSILPLAISALQRFRLTPQHAPLFLQGFPLHVLAWGPLQPLPQLPICALCYCGSMTANLICSYIY